jgi:hypothetical protein
MFNTTLTGFFALTSSIIYIYNKRTTRLHFVPRLRIRGVIPPLNHVVRKNCAMKGRYVRKYFLAKYDRICNSRSTVSRRSIVSKFSDSSESIAEEWTKVKSRGRSERKFTVR